MCDMVKSVHWLWRLQSDCGNCSLIAGIAVWLLRLQSDCWDCSLIAEIAVLNSALGAWHTLESGPLYVRHGKISSLIVEIAVWFWGLHYDCWYCSLIAEIAVWLLRLQKFRNLLIHAPTLHKVSGCNLHNWTAIYTIRLQCRRIAVWLLRLQSDCWDCTLIAEIAVWLLRLQSDCLDCSLIAEIAV